ncbi:MAG: aquaporin [Bacillati bacterium ANGP1]|uniref:Aquaporin n=1 Tax=Candidatus Segetimicrobium genomatis TaxID=2569760 RepID=A0A537KSB2_9BACT|nr:MAG: aquaporin [Terrabacteria group bacterium ANGP1]
MTPSLWRAALAEAVGTFALIFIGAGSVIADQLSGGRLGLVGVALAHGLAIATMVSATGHVSGGHLNPAVTAGFVVARRMTVRVGVGYVVAQLVGASVGGFLLVASFPEAARQAVHLGTPALGRGVTPGVGIVVETVLTFLLVFTVFGVAVDARGPRGTAGLMIGLVIAMDILAGGVLTGGAMNPARAFGPALFSGAWQNHLVYWLGPLLGGAAAAWLYESTLIKQETR